MSYYESNYYENPGPAYCSSDIDEPVPGWGGEVNMAGGRVVGLGAGGMGATMRAAPLARPRGSTSTTATVDQAEALELRTGLPWWAWVLLMGGIGAGVGLARNRGYLTKIGLPR